MQNRYGRETSGSEICGICDYKSMNINVYGRIKEYIYMYISEYDVYSSSKFRKSYL